MTILTSISLTCAIFLLAASPGPGLFAIISRSLANGFSHASIMTMGLILGDIIYLLMAIYGLNSIATLMGDFFILIKYLGGGYLIYLGYKIWISDIDKLEETNTSEISWSSNFFSGLFITLGNPKVIMFYLGFLPLFINLETLTPQDILLVVLIVSSTLAMVILTYAFLAEKSRKFFKTQDAIKRLNKSSGAIMMGAGSLLILKD